MSSKWVGESFSRIALPTTSCLLDRDKFQVVYDTQKKIPSYVYERITTHTISGNATRSSCRFREDPDLPDKFRSKRSDYTGSGYDKGHLCPADNCKSSHRAMKDSFYLSNVSPQTSELNGKQWLELEQTVQSWVFQYSFIEVFSGGAFLPKKCPDGKHRMIYEVIGDNQVAVPTHFFKVLYLHREGTVKDRAYLLPNEQIPESESFESFRLEVESVERVTGIIFKSLAMQ